MGTDEPQSYTRPWLAAVLDLCVLAVLGDGDRHGYAIAHDLEEAELGTVKGGTLYPLLARLEGDGLIAHHWEPSESGPPRKCYGLTEAGHTRLRDARAQWIAFTHRATELFDAVDADRS
jgi:PadR family transcriptional regulator, regulatory protein PadR